MKKTVALIVSQIVKVIVPETPKVSPTANFIRLLKDTIIRNKETVLSDGRTQTDHYESQARNTRLKVFANYHTVSIDFISVRYEDRKYVVTIDGSDFEHRLVDSDFIELYVVVSTMKQILNPGVDAPNVARAKIPVRY